MCRGKDPPPFCPDPCLRPPPPKKKGWCGRCFSEPVSYQLPSGLRPRTVKFWDWHGRRFHEPVSHRLYSGPRRRTANPRGWHRRRIHESVVSCLRRWMIKPGVDMNGASPDRSNTGCVPAFGSGLPRPRGGMICVGDPVSSSVRLSPVSITLSPSFQTHPSSLQASFLF